MKTPANALQTLIECLEDGELKDFEESGRLEDHVWRSIETLKDFLQQRGLREHLKPGVMAELMSVGVGGPDFYITQKARKQLGDEVRRFVMDSFKMLDHHCASVMGQLARARLPMEEEPNVHQTWDKNGMVFIKDGEYGIFLVALQQELIQGKKI